MNPLPELFSEPFAFDGLVGDVALPAAAFAGSPAGVYYDGRPERVEYVRCELVAAGVPPAAARAFLASSEPVPGAALGILGDLGRMLGRAWHRDDHGRFAPSDGAGVAPVPLTDVSAATPQEPNAVRAKATVDASLRQSSVSKAKSGEYRAAMASVFDNMTPAAVARFNANVGSIRFVPQFAEVAAAVRKQATKLGLVGDVPDGVCGCYFKDDRSLVVDGGVPGAPPEDGVHAAGVYAHEIGHVLDGPNEEISSSPAWQAAWQSEIVQGRTPPSDYAQRTAQEGMAEFHRMLVANRHAAAQVYPKCAAVWKAHGLI